MRLLAFRVKAMELLANRPDALLVCRLHPPLDAPVPVEALQLPGLVCTAAAALPAAATGLCIRTPAVPPSWLCWLQPRKNGLSDHSNNLLEGHA